MMNLKVLVPVALGILSVLQAGLNKKAATKFDLSSAALLNNAVLFILSFAVFFWFSRSREPSAPNLWPAIQAWNFLPGILGICLVAGIPWAISKWGTSAVFVGLITSQIVTSIVWDKIAENRTLGKPELFGAGLSVLGVVFMNMKA